MPEIERELAAIGARAVIAGPDGQGRVIGSLDRTGLPALEHVIASEGGEIAGAVLLDDLLAARARAGRRPRSRTTSRC